MTKSLLLYTVGAALTCAGIATGVPGSDALAGSGGHMVVAQAVQPQPRAPGAPGAPDSIPEKIERKPEGATMPGAPASMPGAAAKPATPPQSVIGKDLVTASGKKAGEIQKVVGDQVIVSVGGFLGIGARDVALLWKDLTVTGEGDQMKLRTAMEEAELKALPAYEDPQKTRPAGEGAGTPPPAGSPGRSAPR